jgi:hypothetical protein
LWLSFVSRSQRFFFAPFAVIVFPELFLSTRLKCP